MTDFLIDGYPVKRYGYRDGRHSNYRLLKLLLLKKYGVCYHCNKKVKDYPQTDGSPTPLDQATIDHLTPRKNGNKLKVGQFRKKHEVVEKVLCCYECNRDLNNIVQKAKVNSYRANL